MGSVNDNVDPLKAFNDYWLFMSVGKIKKIEFAQVIHCDFFKSIQPNNFVIKYYNWTITKHFIHINWYVNNKGNNHLFFTYQMAA